GGQLVRERGLPVAAGPPVQVLRIGVAVPIALRGDQDRAAAQRARDRGGAPVRRRRGRQAVEEVDHRVAPSVLAVVRRQVDGDAQTALEGVGEEGGVDERGLDDRGVRVGGCGDQRCCRERRYESTQAHRGRLATFSGSRLSGRIRPAVGTDPLGIDRETMRELGYRTVDLLVDWLNDAEAPPLRRATGAEMRERLSGPPPDGPKPMDAILEGLARDVLPFASRVHHPAFFAFIPGSGTWPGALGDFVASAANLYAGSWMEAAGPSQVELEVLHWFASWLGLPESASGLLVSGGSAANLTALACARERMV